MIAPGLNELDTKWARRNAALNRAVDCGCIGVRAGVNPFTVDPDETIDTDRMVNYVEEVCERGLELNVLFYPFADEVTQGWEDLYGVGNWSTGRLGPPPNQLRPPAGTDSVVWAEIREQVQVVIDAIVGAWSLPDEMLTFEFGNEPWCGGAWGLELGIYTDVEGANKQLERGDLDNAFHNLAQYMMVTNDLDFYDYVVVAPAMVSHATDAELTRQMTTMFYSDGALTYRGDFHAWGFNNYPRLADADDPPQNMRWGTGAAICRKDAVDRAVAQIARMRAQTTIGAKPIFLQETGVGAFLGGFIFWNGTSNSRQFGRPFWYQEQGRYLAATVFGLLATEAARVGIFTLVPNPYDDDAFAYEGSYGLTEPGTTPEYRASLLTVGRALGAGFTSGTFTWKLCTEFDESIQLLN